MDVAGERMLARSAGSPRDDSFVVLVVSSDSRISGRSGPGWPGPPSSVSVLAAIPVAIPSFVPTRDSRREPLGALLVNAKDPRSV